MCKRRVQTRAIVTGQPLFASIQVWSEGEKSWCLFCFGFQEEMLTFHFSFLLAVSSSVNANYQVKGLTYEVKEPGCGRNSTSCGNY